MSVEPDIAGMDILPTVPESGVIGPLTLEEKVDILLTRTAKLERLADVVLEMAEGMEKHPMLGMLLKGKKR